MDWTIVVLRTARGEALFDRAAADGIFEVRSMDEFETSMKVLLRLAAQAAPARADAAGPRRHLRAPERLHQSALTPCRAQRASAPIRV